MILQVFILTIISTFVLVLSYIHIGFSFTFNIMFLALTFILFAVLGEAYDNIAILTDKLEKEGFKVSIKTNDDDKKENH